MGTSRFVAPTGPFGPLEDGVDRSHRVAVDQGPVSPAGPARLRSRWRDRGADAASSATGRRPRVGEGGGLGAGGDSWKCQP